MSEKQRNASTLQMKREGRLYIAPTELWKKVETHAENVVKGKVLGCKLIARQSSRASDNPY